MEREKDGEREIYTERDGERKEIGERERGREREIHRRREMRGRARGGQQRTPRGEALPLSLCESPLSGRQPCLSCCVCAVKPPR